MYSDGGNNGLLDCLCVVVLCGVYRNYPFTFTCIYILALKKCLVLDLLIKQQSLAGTAFFFFTSSTASFANSKENVNLDQIILLGLSTDNTIYTCHKVITDTMDSEKEL